MIKRLKNNIPLHKLYGFLLLNTSLIIFTPMLLALMQSNAKHLPPEAIASFALSLLGVVLSILFIMRKKIAIQLLTYLLITTIVLLFGYLLFSLFDMRHRDIGFTALMINAFGFFIVEGILGLLIIHSKKLADEFEDYQ